MNTKSKAKFVFIFAISYLLVFLMSYSMVQAQGSKTVKLNKKLGYVGASAYFYLGDVTITRTTYTLSFYFLTTYTIPRLCHVKVDNIYVGNYRPVQVRGISLGRVYTHPNSVRFSVEVSREHALLRLTGVGDDSKDFKINLTEFDSLLPRQALTHDVYGSVYTTQTVNVRSGPGTNYKKIGTLEPREELTLKEETEDWYRFSSEHFEDAWVAKWLTTKIAPEIKVEKTPPTLTITDPELIQNIHRTEEYIVTISGRATDDEGVAFVTVNGQNADLRADGRFMKRMKLKIGKNEVIVKVVDVNDNMAEKKFFVMREEAVAEAEFSDIDFAPETGKRNSHGIGVVIGIEEYQYAPKVTFAYNDAEIFRSYLIKTFGFSRDNIYFKTNERATKGEFEKIFSKRGWLSRHASSKSDVIIYYAGHGGPESKTKESFLIPHDIDPNYASTGYSLKQLYSDLSNIKAKTITVILDACFSGGTREAQMLLADARPLVHIEIERAMIPKNTVIFSAASGSEISSAYKQRLHGLFTYFFLKGLNGDADGNKDRKITVQEIHKFLEDHVPKQASRIGRDQTPQLIGADTGRVLVTY